MPLRPETAAPATAEQCLQRWELYKIAWAGIAAEERSDGMQGLREGQASLLRPAQVQGQGKYPGHLS